MIFDSPLVSVRIAAYNHEKFIQKTLDSVLEDDYPNKELIIIDDGSTDSTAKIIEYWINLHKKEIPIKYKTRENKGLVYTINELISMCKGKYICGIASDDYLINDSLYERVLYLENNRSKMAVFGDCKIVDENDRVLYKSGLQDYYKINKSNYFDDESLKNEIITNWGVPGPVLMVKKKLYSHYNINYNKNLNVEDWDMYLKLVSENLLGFIDYKVSVYRLHRNNFSLKFQDKVLKERFLTIFYNLNRFSIINKLKLLFVSIELIKIYIIRKLIKLKNRLF